MRPGDGGGFPHQAHHPDLPLPGRRVHGRHRPPAGGGGRQDPGPARAGRKQRRRRRGRGHRLDHRQGARRLPAVHRGHQPAPRGAHQQALLRHGQGRDPDHPRRRLPLRGPRPPGLEAEDPPGAHPGGQGQARRADLHGLRHRHRRPHRRRGDGRERGREVQPPAVQGRPGVLGLAARRATSISSRPPRAGSPWSRPGSSSSSRPTATRASSASRTSRR